MPELEDRSEDMADVFICDFIRTPIGRHGGALARVRADDLAAVPIRSLIERNRSIDLVEIDEVLLGCANQAGEDNRNVARMAALLAGLPEEGLCCKHGARPRGVTQLGD